MNRSKFIRNCAIFGILASLAFFCIKQTIEIKRKEYKNKIEAVRNIASNLEDVIIDKEVAEQLGIKYNKKVLVDTVSLAEMLDHERNSNMEKELINILNSTKIKIADLIYPPFGQTEFEITSEYNEIRRKGRKYVVHKGIDLVPKADSRGYRNSKHPIHAGMDGIVVLAGRDRLHGNSIVIQIDENKYIQYSHLSKISKEIKVGSLVYTGQILGNMGNSGRSNGSHLHLELFELPEGVSYTEYRLNRENWGNLNEEDRIKKDYIDPTPFLGSISYFNGIRAIEDIQSLRKHLNKKDSNFYDFRFNHLVLATPD